VPSENGALLARILEWEVAREARVAEQVKEHDWGRAFLSPTVPLVWDANWILVERTGAAAEEIIEAADRSIGSAGMRHRTVLVREPEDGRRLVPEFEARGWGVEPGLRMVHRRAPDRESEIRIAECRMDEIADLRTELIRKQLAEIGVHDEDVTDQLLEWERRLGVCDGDRWFVAPADGEPASACRLLARDGVAQIEDVGTLPEARGHGLARAVTVAAAKASEDGGNELTFLVAAADDWPRLLYDKLGFDEIGCLHAFRRHPQVEQSVCTE
jgi:ribosomal protein S18 acetylase RimI-like enzyme